MNYDTILTETPGILIFLQPFWETPKEHKLLYVFYEIRLSTF